MARKVTADDIAQGAAEVGIAGLPSCVHVSMRSFGVLEKGAETVVEGLLGAGCTALVPSFSHQFEVAPPMHDRPSRNGIDYAAPRTYFGDGLVYGPDAVIEPWLGNVAAYVAARRDVVRGGDAVGSFAAVGPLAADLIVEHTGDMFGPLRALARLDGWVVLMGVGLNRMTLLHLAEVMAGRRPFIRWVAGPEGVVRLGVGLCSEGFLNLEPTLATLERTMTVGSSLWRAFPAAATVEAAAREIRVHPEVTWCGRNCVECADAIAGGPIG